MKNECRKGIKRLAALFAVMLLMLSLLAGCATDGTKSRYELDVVNHTSDFYVNDFAGVFSDEQKKELMEKAVGFDEGSSGIQVVITTVESLDSAVLGYEYVVEDAEGNRVEDSKQPSSTPKFTIEQVSYSMYNEYGIGKDDMGILILFSTGDREVRIETGRNMQFYITDSISGRLLDDYGMEYFREDKFADGRSALSAASTPEELDAANAQITENINQFLAVVENYPTITASEQYTSLMDSIEGAANRINVAREDYNAAVSQYNRTVRRFPGSLLAGFFGFDTIEEFKADEAANNSSIVDFGD